MKRVVGGVCKSAKGPARKRGPGMLARGARIQVGDLQVAARAGGMPGNGHQGGDTTQPTPLMVLQVVRKVDTGNAVGTGTLLLTVLKGL